MNTYRRTFLGRTAGLGLATLLSSGVAGRAWAQSGPMSRMQFAPEPGDWRTFDVTTRIDLPPTTSRTRVWVPLPSVQTDWQQGVMDGFDGNGDATIASDGAQGVRMVAATFDAGVKQPWLEVTSRVRTQSRALQQRRGTEAASTLRHALQPTRLLPTDGIVHDTALRATQGARSDEDKARALYEWIVANAWREPEVAGCGEGDIRTMLETGDLGGKCADINALFVGMARSVGLPARDVYGIRVAPSQFGYQQLGANPDDITGAQHCRAEVYLEAHGWTAMDPADVAKVMRQERPEWIKDVAHPIIEPVYDGLYGAWEGNWVAYNSAHDVQLPGSQGDALGFLMYPMAEDAQGRFDPYDASFFEYKIRAEEV